MESLLVKQQTIDKKEEPYELENMTVATLQESLELNIDSNGTQPGLEQCDTLSQEVVCTYYLLVVLLLQM
jgi:hypothetical protein